MSAAIICVFMNSSFSSVPRRFTYAILRNKSCCLVDFTIKFTSTQHVCVYAVPTFLIKKKKEAKTSHLIWVPKRQRNTPGVGFPQLSSPALWRKILENLSLAASSRRTNLTKTKPCRVTQNSRENQRNSQSNRNSGLHLLHGLLVHKGILPQTKSHGALRNRSRFFLTKALSNPRFCRHTAHLFSRLATTSLNLHQSLTSFQGWLPPLPHNFPFPWQALGRSVASRCRGQSHFKPF